MVDQWKKINEKRRRARIQPKLPEGMNRQYRVSSGTITLSKAFAQEHGDRMVADALALMSLNTPKGTVVSIVKENPYPALLGALPEVYLRRGKQQIRSLRGQINYCFGLDHYDSSPIDYVFNRAVGGPIRRFQGPGFHDIYKRVLAAQQQRASGPRL